MSHVYVTSDWHIGHNGITDRFRTQFPNIDAHDEYILNRVRETVNKRDVLYVLGDAFWTHKALNKVLAAEIPCRMYLVRGNHDTLTAGDYLHVFKDVYGAFRYKKYWFTHIPIHPSELYRGKNVHGHCHRGGPNQTQKADDWESYYNAKLDRDWETVLLVAERPIYILKYM